MSQVEKPTKPYKLSPELAEIVGKQEASRAECTKQLWSYIKKHDLQDSENRQFFTSKNGLLAIPSEFFSILGFECL